MKLAIVGFLLISIALAAADLPKFQHEHIVKGKSDRFVPSAAPSSYQGFPVVAESRRGGDLKIGTCSGFQQVKEIVYKRDVPYTTQFLSFAWYGYETSHVACIVVTNRDPDNEAIARVTSGGVGEDFVVLQLVSSNGDELDFDVEIWAAESPLL